MSDKRTRYIILNEADISGTLVVRDCNNYVKEFRSRESANNFASRRYGSWVIIRQVMTRGVWMSANVIFE